MNQVDGALAIADTSVFVASESGRSLRAERIPDRLAVSVITIGELRAGVLAADTVATRDLRLRTLATALLLDPIPIDSSVADAWARLRVDLRDANRTMGVNDSWIAATAIAHGLPVVTQDDGYVEIGDLRVIRV